MSRPVLLAAVLLLVTAGPGHAATNTYSTGNISAPIGASFGRSLPVPDRGPVSFVRVAFRIAAPDTSALAVSLVSPKGTEVPLVSHRGTGADFGTGRGCTGELTVLDADMDSNPISKSASPFTDNPYRAEGSLASVYGEDARGSWTLRITNAGKPARLECFTLDISRAVPQVLRANRGAVAATVTFTERNFFFEHVRLRIVRAGRTAVDAPLQKLGCRSCNEFRPVDVAVRDLDGGEPEVLVDLFTGGAHCCSVTLILGWDAAARRYRSKLEFWGNYGSRVVDLDHDGLPEIAAFDERFLYTFTAYVFSAAPPRIVQYRQGRLIDVTRRFPREIEKDAAKVGKSFLRLKHPQPSFDARAFIAAYVADQYLLGRPDVAQKTLAEALAKGLLYRGRTYLGSPAGTAYVSALMRDLRKWGYVS